MSERKVSNFLKETKFKKKVFGGVDEQDVWKKLDNLWAEQDTDSKEKDTEGCNVDLLAPRQVIRTRRKRLLQKSEIISFFIKLILLIMFIYVIFGMIFGITAMKNNDMTPKISPGDLMLYYRLENNFHNKDVIVFEKDGVQYVGRIVAKNGDKVEVTDDEKLKINNVTASENNIYYSTPKYDDYVEYPITLKENQFFILCDFRKGAKDSRYFGVVELQEIKGRVITILRRTEL